MLEVITKSEVEHSAVRLLNTSFEDLWDGDDDKIYTNFNLEIISYVLF